MRFSTITRAKAALAAFALLFGLAAAANAVAADATLLAELSHGDAALIERLAVEGQKPSWIPDPVTGFQALQWPVTAGDGARSIHLTGLVRDLGQSQWSRATRLDATVRVDLAGDANAPVRLRLWIRGNRYFHFEAETTIPRNRSAHVGFDLTAVPTRIGTGPVEEVRFDLLDVPATGGAQFRLKEFRVTGADPDGKLNRAIVDRYGQFIPNHWPEKIAFDRDLVRQRAREEAWLKANPPLPQRDRFGGDTAGPRRQASGFFRLEPDEQGRWWFITPDGHRLFSYGLDAASLWLYTDPTGRETLYEWLPDGPFKHALAGKELRLYSANLHRKYGDGWQQAWRTRSIERFKAWGMNTLGAWADGSLTEARQMPYTYSLQLQWQPEWTALPRVTSLIPDPFDPAFEAHLARSVPALVRPMREDPWLMGYFIANELAWHELTVGRLLDLPASSAARRALRESLSRQYATPAAWAKAWGITAAPDWSALDGLTKQSPLNAAAQADLARFRGELADRFFEIYCRVLRGVDPNHLVLGARFLHHPAAHQPPDEVYAAAGRHCDAISENAYDLTASPAYYAKRYELAKKPILVSEFHWGVTNTPRQLGWGVTWVPSREARAALLREYVKGLAQMPQVVGAHYFQYTDQPLLGRHDGENAQIGFVDSADTPYEELIDVSREIGREMYRWRVEMTR